MSIINYIHSNLLESINPIASVLVAQSKKRLSNVEIKSIENLAQQIKGLDDGEIVDFLDSNGYEYKDKKSLLNNLRKVL
jgi:hypothetical protein